MRQKPNDWTQEEIIANINVLVGCARILKGINNSAIVDGG